MDVVAVCHNGKLTAVLKVVCFKTTVNFLSYLKGECVGMEAVQFR